MTARLLVVDGHEPSLRRLGNVLKTVQPDLTEVPYSTWLASWRASPAPCGSGTVASGVKELSILDWDALTVEQRALIVESPVHLDPSRRVLVLSSGAVRTSFTDLFSRSFLTNLLAKNSEADAHELLVTVQKILRGDIFGIEKYLIWGLRPEVIQVCRATQKADVLKRAAEFVAAAGISHRFAQNFFTVIDEFVTNAVYNAPTDGQQRHRFAHLPRTEEVVLPPEEAATVKFTYDGRRLGVSVEDPFGSLEPARVLHYLAKCFRAGDDQIDTKEGGAGLGIYSVFDALSRFVINVEPERRTEMIGFIDITETYREYAERGKSFNLFVV